MHLEQEISQSLYRSIQEKYEAGLYRDAILGALFHLEECIRSKLKDTDYPSGRVDLVQQAFGQPTPALTLNGMSTTAQILEQIHFGSLLLGMFQGIGEPRIHADLLDDVKTADAIIVFVDYLIDRVEHSLKIETTAVG